MLHKLSKKLIGKRPATMRITDYYNVVDHVEHKIKEAILIVLIGLLFGIGILAFLVHGFTEQTGYYAPDYMDSNGVLYDTDGDGDYYHWVEE